MRIKPEAMTYLEITFIKGVLTISIGESKAKEWRKPFSKEPVSRDRNPFSFIHGITSC